MAESILADLEAGLAAYNDAAKGCGWPQATRLTDARRRRLHRAILDAGGLAGWKSAMHRAGRSPFLTGRTGRTGAHASWRPDFDFFVRPDKLLKLLEGGFDEADRPAVEKFSPQGLRTPASQPVAAPFVPEHPDVRDAALIVSWRKAGRWDKANAVEERMAARQGRPPVLVPAPEVAMVGMPERSPPPMRAARRGPITEIEVDGYEFIPEGENYGGE